MDEHGKIHWHDAHFEALQLEFHEYLHLLLFEKERELNRQALRMDTLIIKKIKDVEISKNIGRIFKNYNIVEYKSEKDNFSLWDYNKVIGYAFIYSAFEEVPMSNITISISLTIFPRELIKFLENERGLTVQNLGDGIYHIIGEVVPIQILESKNLSKEENLFLRNLRSNLSCEDMQKTLESYREYKPIDDKNKFLDTLIKANPYSFKEVTSMFSEGTRHIIMGAAEKNGWFESRDNNLVIENAKKIARKMLMHGRPTEEVVEMTELPFETVTSLANQLEKIPAAH